MADLAVIRKRFKAAAAVLAGISVLAAAALLAPIGATSAQQRQRIKDMRTEFLSKQSQVMPLRGMDQKLLRAEADIKTFYSERLPTRYSAISDEIGKLAQENQVKLSSMKYDRSDAEVAALQQVRIEMNVSGDYVPIVRFINAVERSKIFFLVDEISLAEEKQSQKINLSLRVETFLRPAAAGEQPQKTQSAEAPGKYAPATKDAPEKTDVPGKSGD